MSNWIVLVEAARAVGNGPISVEDVETLGTLLGAGTAVHLRDRYAVQLRLFELRAVDALDRAVTLWEESVAALGLPRWDLVRAEVFTEEQLEWELANWESDAKGTTVVLSETEDSTAVDAAAEELLREVFRDPLTGLRNEMTLRAAADRALAGARPTRCPAVIRLDLDGLDAFIRRFGHAARDELLLAVTRRLSTVLRPVDLVARLGADQFAILLEESSEKTATAVSERVVSALRSPLLVGSEKVALLPTAGVALGRAGQDAEDVLREAASALARAKAAGGGRTALFTGEVERATVQPVRNPMSHRNRLSYLLLVQGAAAAANQATTLQQAAQVVLSQVCAHTDWAVGHLLVVPPERPRDLVSTAVWHLPAPAGDRFQAFRRATETVRFSAEVGLPGRVLATGRPVWIPDLADGPVPERATAAADCGLRAALASPVVVGDDVVGVLEFFSLEPLPVNSALLEVLAAVGLQLGRVVERSRANDALWESQALLREAQALGRLGSWHADLRTGRTTWSDELYEVLGLDRATTVPSHDAFAALVHPEDFALVEADSRRTVVGPGDPVEFRVVRPDGEVRWVVRRSSFVYDEMGAVAYHATVQDISDYKRVAECSLACEVRWHLMLQGSQEMLTLLNRDGAIRVSFAPVGMDALGSPEGERVMFLDVVHPDDAGIVRNVLAELLADPDASVAFQVRFRDDLGKWHWFDSIATNLLDEALIGAIVVNSLDVTEQKWLQERLEERVFRR